MHIVLTRRAEPLDVPDGINVFIFSLADELLALGHRVTVVSGPASDPKKVREFFHLSAIPGLISLTDDRSLAPARRVALWWTRGRRIVNRLEPDLVIVNGVVPVKFRGLTCAVAHDMEQRDDLVGRYQRIAYKWLAYRLADKVVATCSEVKHALVEELRLPPSRVAVISTCVSANSYQSKTLDDRRDAVLHLGTVGYKNAVATVRALARLEGSATRLLITGPRTAELEALLDAVAGELRERIEVLGYVSADELRELLASVKVVSVPSRYHVAVASPTVLESFASGTPVVGSTSISADLLRDGINGYRCDPDDEDQVARTMRDLLLDDERWQTLSDGARRTATEFDSGRIAQSYLRALEEA